MLWIIFETQYRCYIHIANLLNQNSITEKENVIETKLPISANKTLFHAAYVYHTVYSGITCL